MAHTNITGAHDTGKSTLLKSLAVEEIEAGSAVIFLDPSGVEVDEVMTNTPYSRLKDTLLFDPILNLSWGFLENTDNIPLVASTVSDTLRGSWRIKIIPPNIEATVESLIYTALSFNLTLVDCLFMLKDKTRFDLYKISNTVLKDFWTNYYNKTDKDKDLVSWSTYTKLYKLLLDPRMQSLFGNKEGTISIKKQVDSGVTFVRLPLSFWGDSKVSLIGSVFLAQVYLASLTRNPERPLYIYIDEVYRFAPTIVAKMLDALGKQNVHIVTTHQTVGQVDKELFASLMGNCENKYAFRVSPEDTDALMKNQIINSSWRLEGLSELKYRQLPWTPALKDKEVEPLPEKNNKRIEQIIKHTKRNYCKGA